MSPSKPSLLGRWQMLRAELNGETAPELVTSKTELEFTTSEYVVRYAGEVMDAGTYAIDTGEGPLTLVLRGVNGPNQGRTIPCTFQIVGRRLRINYGLNGQPPLRNPAEGSGPHYMATYARTTDETRALEPSTPEPCQ